MIVLHVDSFLFNVSEQFACYKTLEENCRKW